MGVEGSQTNTSCVLDPDPTRQVISMQMCGNGIVEQGEECDPGLGNNSTCCDPQTCKFTAGAVCDPGSSTCCTSDCQMAPATQLCRKSRDDRCDVPEFCTGNSSTCPTDITTPNGEDRFSLRSGWFSSSLLGRSCGSGGLSCADGICTSLDCGFPHLCTFTFKGTDHASVQCQSAGSTLGLVKACSAKNDRSCQVSCQDPRTASQCIVLQTQLVDGSPCGTHNLICGDEIVAEAAGTIGYGGTCVTGSCHSGSIWDTFTVRFPSVFQGP